MTHRPLAVPSCLIRSRTLLGALGMLMVLPCCTGKTAGAGSAGDPLLAYANGAQSVVPALAPGP